MTIAEALARLQCDFERAAVASAKAEARLMLAELTGLGLAELTLFSGQQLSQQQQECLKRWVARRQAHEPLQYIVGKLDFYGLELDISPAALIPRPETEYLVELVLQQAPKALSILDIATGSGAIALALKDQRPAADVWASDISLPALELAAKNATRLELRIDFIHADLLTNTQAQAVAAGADVITANLPYLQEDDRRWLSQELRHEPALALFSGGDGLAHFRRLEQQAFDLMKPRAQLWLELDPRNIRTAWQSCERWAERDIHADLVGRERFLRLLR